MEKLMSLKIAYNKNELRKRLNNNILDDISKKYSYGEEKPFLESHSNRQVTKTIFNDARANRKAKQTDMTWSILSDITNTNTTMRTTTRPTNRSRTKVTKKIMKRSLSESSAEKYHRSKEAVSENGCSSTRKMWQNELIIRPESETAQPKQRQRPINELENVKKRSKRNHFISDMIDVGIRVLIVLVFIKLETTTAFHRNIHIEELWLYKNPRTVDFVSPTVLILSVLWCPLIVSLLHLYITRDRRDFRAANWVWTLSVCLNAVATSLLKITAGRPRPDFFYRCFPDGVLVANVTPTAVNFNCTGKWRDINEGYKSFPSGHSSFAFASFGFIALYWCGKFHAFNSVGRGESWRLFASVWPLFVAALIAVSRTCDYHHHWQDVLCGSVIGFAVACLTYRQYYPSIFSPNSHLPLPRDGSRVHFIKNCDYFDGSHRPIGNKFKESNSKVEKDELFVSEDQMPLICNQDDDVE